jgi:RsiW-degrading membrane proteinase PrsW (M82 family)
MMFKKALMPLFWLLLAIVVLAAAVIWYQKKFGEAGPFPEAHEHEGNNH